MREKIKTAENELEIFLEAILPDNASQVQINETRMAFIGGLYQSTVHIMQLSNLQEDEAEKQLSLYLDDIQKLVKKYAIKGK